MAKSKTAEFHWDHNSKQFVVSKLGFGKVLNQYFAQTLVDYSDGVKSVAQLTPEKSGELKDSVIITASPQQGKIVYGASYAMRHYEHDDDNHPWNRYTPGTHSAWLDLTWQWYKPNITTAVGMYRAKVSK